MNNVVALPGIDPPDEKGQINQRLVEALRGLLDMAERGQLQTIVATGITGDGFRTSTYVAGNGVDTCQLLGALEVTKAEFLHRYWGDKL